MKKRGIAFLNEPGSYYEGTIAWSVHTDGSFLTIADCSRKVSLDIECYKPDKNDKGRQKRGFENSLYKINALIRELQACEKALVVEGKKYGYVS